MSIPCQEPRSAPIRWMMDVGAELTPEIRQRLFSGLFTSVAALVVGACNTVIIALIAYIRSGNLLFLGIAAMDAGLLALRLRCLRRPQEPSDLLFASGLLWTMLQGITIVLIVVAGDMPMMIVALASGLGAVGGIIGRNFAAPRYALAQTNIIDLSFKVSFACIAPEFIPLLVIQSVIFVVINVSLIRQQRATMIRALTAEVESRKQSSIDPLTKLLNRRGLDEAFAREGRADGTVALFYLDLDGFKQVNDRLGHAAGDFLLLQVGERLGQSCDPSAAICRLGGDEFLVLTALTDERVMQALGIKLVKALSLPYQIEDSVLASIGVSVGIAFGVRQRTTLATLMARADEALYGAKLQGKGRCVLYRGGSNDATTPPDLALAS